MEDQVAKASSSIGRRGFLKGAATGAAALVAQPAIEAEQVAQTPAVTPAATPSDTRLARETSATPPQVQPGRFVESPQSDHMVDVIQALGLEYVAANPGSSFEGLHESIINYGENKSPELLTALHEESSVAMAHGYAKAEGKPMGAILHGVIGIQHAAMAIYNAYCDRVPIFMIAGVDVEGAVPAHNATDMASLVRGYVKWDYQPDNLTQFTNGMFRAYRLMMTPPMAPVLLVLDSRIQKDPLTRRPPIPKLVLPAPPAADLGSVREIARQLVAATNPRVQAGRAIRTHDGLRLMVELAELLQMPVNVGGDRVNFPSRHPLGGNGAGNPDLILMLEATGGGGLAGGANADAPTPRRISISTAELLATANFNVLGNPPQTDLLVTGDPEATLPALIEEVRKLMTPDRKAFFQERGRKHADANRHAREQTIELARFGWDSSPISTARITAELWALIKNEDWSLVSPASFFSSWPLRLWDMNKTYSYLGGQGGGGMGYGAPAAVGAALALRKHGRIPINIQTDGDLNYAPGVLWTAVHHKIPLLTIMHNNRGYHQEVMFIQQMCSVRNRGAKNAHVGTAIKEPNISYAKLADGYGMYAEGPIDNPKDLGPALARGIERVKKGEPVLLDVITQPR
jgi:thiamine pyrophosphate-dependent acetolactate synthase large subunit-like protein